MTVCTALPRLSSIKVDVAPFRVIRYRVHPGLGEDQGRFFEGQIVGILHLPMAGGLGQDSPAEYGPPTMVDIRQLLVS